MVALVTPNAELTGTPRHTGLADGRMIDLCGRRPGRYAVACPVERPVRHRLVTDPSDSNFSGAKARGQGPGLEKELARVGASGSDPLL